MTQQQVDGHEAYRDDPEYTAPEMRPGNGEDIKPEPNTEFTVIAGAGMTGGVAGGALAGEILVVEIAEEKAETAVNPDGEF
jgi:hypothetical protein